MNEPVRTKHGWYVSYPGPEERAQMDHTAAVLAEKLKKMGFPAMPKPEAKKKKKTAKVARNVSGTLSIRWPTLPPRGEFNPRVVSIKRLKGGPFVRADALAAYESGIEGPPQIFWMGRLDGKIYEISSDRRLVAVYIPNNIAVVAINLRLEVGSLDCE